MDGRKVTKDKKGWISSLPYLDYLLTSHCSTPNLHTKTGAALVLRLQAWTGAEPLELSWMAVERSIICKMEILQTPAQSP